jgi:hypothetical protein
MEAEFTVNQGPRQAVISTIPGSMDPVGSNYYCMKTGGGIVVTFFISFNAAPSKCSLDKNTQYYLNMKSMVPDQAIDYLLLSSSQP